MSQVVRTEHEMNIPWFESPFFFEMLERAELDQKTKEQVQEMHENGYIIFDIEMDRFDEVADEINQQLAKDYYKNSERIQDAWRFNEHVKQLAVFPQILDLLQVLYQRNPVPFQTLNFQRGTEQATHSDLLHFQSVPHRFMCGVWIALEDVHAGNGPLHYYPKSHKLPFYDLHDIGLTATGKGNTMELYKQYEQFIASLVKAHNLERVEVDLKKGQALIWAANLLHGGSPIRDKGSTRFSQVTHYYFSGGRYYTPMKSDPFLGKLYWREVTDIRTKKIIPQYYNGERVNLPLLTRFDQLIRQNYNNRLVNIPFFRNRDIFKCCVSNP